MIRFIDLTGKRFGRWKVLAIHPERRRPLWLCRCDCGGGVALIEPTAGSPITALAESASSGKALKKSTPTWAIRRTA